MTDRDAEFMGEALVEAQKSLEVDEFPVGAVVVLGDEVVVRAHWKGVAQRRLLDHAEMLALLEAERSGKVSRRHERQEATLYTTLEPCALCMAAAMSFCWAGSYSRSRHLSMEARTCRDSGGRRTGIHQTACPTQSRT